MKNKFSTASPHHVHNPRSSVKSTRSGKNYFRGDAVLYPTKDERKKIYAKYKEWDLRYNPEAMSFKEVAEWSRFLESKPWQFFATFTTKHEMTAKSARRSMDLFNDLLSKELTMLNSDDPYECFWVIEPHAKHGKAGVHIHALLSLPTYWRNRSRARIAFDVICNMWQRVTGGRKAGSGINDGLWNRIDLQTYRGQSACRYTTKYLTKSLVDWDYFCTFNNEIDEGVFANID